VRQRGDGLKAFRPIFQEREKTDLLRGYCHDPDQTNRVNKTGYDTVIRVKTSPIYIVLRLLLTLCCCSFHSKCAVQIVLISFLTNSTQRDTFILTRIAL
jgi:hypothetical protein